MPATRVHVFDTMGTTASLRAAAGAPLDRIEAVFAAMEQRFSLYRPDSEASRIARGETRLTEASAETLEAYAEALDWRTATDGAFTPHRPDGVIDLAGTVKARAMHAAGRLLDESGCTEWLLNVGGDVLARGKPAGAPWSVGIVDPTNRQALLCSVPLTDARRAVATSGTAERGEHVWRRPSDGDAPFRQVSVLSDDIVTADVLATAILAGGRRTLDTVLDRHDVDVLACADDGSLLVSPRLRRLITGPGGGDQPAAFATSSRINRSSSAARPARA